MIENIILAILVPNFLFREYIKFRELRRLCSPPSKMYQKLASPEQIEKTRRYSRDKLVMSSMEAALTLAKTVWLVKKRVFTKVFQYYKGIGAGENLAETLYVISYLHFERVLAIPFSLVSVFYIEAKYNFNKMTARTFVMDFLKITVVLTAMLFPLMYGILKIMKMFKDTVFYPYVWLFSAVFQIFLVIIYPTYIQPLFNKFEEMEESGLKTKIEVLAERVGFRANKILVMDASTRTGHSNAYFVGITKEKRVVLFDTLLKGNSEDEILAILCHEFGHWHFSHTLINIVYGLAIQLGYLYALNMSMKSDGFGNLLPKNMDTVVKNMYFFIFLSVFEIPQTFITNMKSRYHEKQADRFAVEMGYGKELSSGLVKIHEQNNANMDPDPLYSAATYSHPTLIERIELIEKEMNKAK